MSIERHGDDSVEASDHRTSITDDADEPDPTGTAGLSDLPVE
jgi:hypothetical protein